MPGGSEGSLPTTMTNILEGNADRLFFPEPFRTEETSSAFEADLSTVAFVGFAGYASAEAVSNVQDTMVGTFKNTSAGARRELNRELSMLVQLWRIVYAAVFFPNLFRDTPSRRTCGCPDGPISAEEKLRRDGRRVEALQMWMDLMYHEDHPARRMDALDVLDRMADSLPRYGISRSISSIDSDS